MILVKGGALLEPCDFVVDGGSSHYTDTARCHTWLTQQGLSFIGPCGTGHFVQTEHSGVECVDVQFICKAHALFQAAGMSDAEVADVFDKWNEGELHSDLAPVTAKALRQLDTEAGLPVLHLILGKAGHHGRVNLAQVQGRRCHG